MDTKLVLAVFLIFVAGGVCGLAIPLALPYDGWLIVIGPNKLWVGSWWLLGIGFAIVCALVGGACWLLDKLFDEYHHHRDPVSKAELDEQLRLVHSVDLRLDPKAKIQAGEK